MGSSFKEQIRKVKEREAYISYELYRLLRNAIIRRLVYEDSRCEFKEVLPEFPVGDKRADLVVFATRYGGATQPFLVIEVKVRAYARPGPSMAKAVKRARTYAVNLGATPTPFFAVYDGWELMVFRNISPYLIGVYGAIKDEYQARNLLLGLEEFSYKGEREILDKLPKHADPDFLIKRILPFIARELARDPSEAERFRKSWLQLI
ncbi:MAG: hypothetical protein DRP00_00130 [Candidatus Aenigmatarchaeota archaeon]|nr:MAG: hypothetical protein DRP00_00130 [Candidatus Aenigmarchaeota archaeon]